MIISRTPFRVSFFGGGTDYPVWYNEHGGAVLATSIDKYCYITARYLPPFFDHKYRIRYTKREETQSVAEIKHPSVRECLNLVNLDRGVEILHNADLPAMSGIGSSSAFTVGLLNALYALKGEMKTKYQLALDAIHVEQDMIRENVGSQDQVIAAFGGFNRIEFNYDQKITVQPLTVARDKVDTLQKHLMLFFVGFPRNASEIAGDLIRNTPQKQSELAAMTTIVAQAIDTLNGSLERLADFGRLLHEAWMIKRSLAPLITNQLVDEVCEAGLEAGALGGKLLGAGGGGFMLFFVNPELQDKVKEKLKNLLYVPFRFESSGSQIIYYAPQDNF
jgi:D-glycero-alpha-D-manno-heptose-7-phosphate kinase